MTSVLLLVNPTAGGGRARHAALEATRAFRERGVEVDLQVTTRRGEVEARARAAAAAGATRVLVSGGDGTVHEGVNGVARTRCALGILPAGRGNDLAATLGVPLDPADAVSRFLAATPRRIDLGLVHGRRFGTVAGIGFDADVAERTNSGIWRHAGARAYIGGIIASLVAFRAPHLSLALDSTRREGRYLLCAVSNTGRYGAGVRIAPGARADDGLLDVCLVRDLSRLRLLRLLPATYRGSHVKAPEVEMLRTAILTVENGPFPIIADGESVGQTPATFSVDRGALLVL